MPTATLAIAVLTDVHGNGFAVEAVAEDIARFQPDAIINLGDQLWGQANPVLALEVQKSLRAYEVRGNNDERLTLYYDDPRIAGHGQMLQAWLGGQIAETELQRISSLSLQQTLFSGELVALHGTFDTPWQALLWGWNSDGNIFWQLPTAEVERQLPETLEAQVIVVGHSHLPQIREIGGRLLVNIGPVSHQNDGNPQAQWTLLRRRNGHWKVEMRRVTYDWKGAAHWIRQNAPDQSEAEKMTHPRTVTIDSFLNPQ